MATKVVRHGQAYAIDSLKARHKRNCSSAPKAATGLAVAYAKRHVDHDVQWRARVTWNAVTQDVADRPLTVEQYEVQLRATDASGVPIESGNGDFWRETVQGDDTRATVFAPLPKPKTNYFQARVRVLNRAHGGKCWSAWTSWSAATQPVSGAVAGPPAPSGLTLGADKVEGTTKNPWRLRVGWNEIGTWTQAEGDAVDGVDGYHVQLQVATTPNAADAVNLRRMYVPSDPLASTAHADFFNGKGPRYYRARVFAVGLDRPGAWTSWTSWFQPKATPDGPRNVTTTNPTPAILVAKWDPPLDATDVDRYRVQIIKATGGGGTIVDEGFTASNRWTYHIPKNARDTNHRARVYSVTDEISDDVDAGAAVGYRTTESTGVETGDVPVNLEIAVDELAVTDDTAKLLGASGVPRVRYRRAASDPIPHDSNTTLSFDLIEVDTDGFAAESPNYIRVPWAGSYRVTAIARFASNGTGRRTIFLQYSPDEGATWVDMPTLYDVRAAVSGDVATPTAVNTVQFPALCRVRARIYQNSGGTLNLTDASLAVEFLGPA